MDILYIPQLDEGDSSSASEGTDARYRLLKRVPEDGTVNLTDRAVTRVEVTDTDALRLVVPPLVKGAARDFFVRLVITAESAPEITIAAPSGETISFEDADDEVFKCEVGINVFAFTETEQGVFLVNRKQVNIEWEVTFDPGEGTVDKTTATYQLGAPYSTLPKPVRDGYTFLGWFTAAEEGVAVVATDTCKTGVSVLYAHWEVYVDPFVDAICPAKNLTFHSESDNPWTVDAATYATEAASARSGAIDHDGTTSLTTSVTGKGTLTFKWKVSSEQGYDFLRFFVDGTEISRISGEQDWDDITKTISTDGAHEIEWRYTKDASATSGSDCGWVDEVVWTAEG